VKNYLFRLAMDDISKKPLSLLDASLMIVGPPYPLTCSWVYPAVNQV